ncbi:MAG TPA: alkaline phosphatase family protein [Mucilaginibacter sp.]
MKIRQCFLIFAACLMLEQATIAQTRHVVLISIDGLHPDMYLDPGWPALNLRQMMKQGTYAEHMLSVFPSYTYPSHTAMLTGALPARNGIYFNQPVGSKGDWNWFADNIKVPTLWKVLKQNGKTTAAVEWPVSVTKDITWNIPEIWSDEHPDRITESRKYATSGLVEEIERNATGKLDSVNMNEDAFSMDDNSARMAAYIFKTRKPALLAVHFACVDGKEHDDGRDADSVRLALAEVDHNIGFILETIKESKSADSTAVIIVGDHGFSTINQVMRPNMLIRNVPARFIAAGGSAFLYRHARANVSNTSVIRTVIDSLNALPKAKRKLFRIIDKKELDRMGVDSAALLALSGVNGSGLVFSGASAPAKTTNHGPGTFIQQSKYDGVFYPTDGGHHGYDPSNQEMYTGFIAWGAGIVKGGHIDHLSEPDIAVLIAKLLVIDFHGPDGKYVNGIIQIN